MKKIYKIILLFGILVLLQLIYSFLVPNYGTNECWKSLSTMSSYKGHSFDRFDTGLVGKVKGWLGDYHAVCDGAGFVLLAHDFPQDYFRGRLLFINRPVFPWLVHLVAAPLHLISTSYSLTFVAALLLNCLLLFLTALLSFSLIKKYFDERVALISTALLIVSPFAHSWLVQTETSIFGTFAFVLSFFLLDKYLKKSNNTNLILYSLLVGILVLGKMNLIFTIFVLALAAIYKKYRQGAIFFVLHLIPFLLWYLLVTKVWGLGFGLQEVQKFGAGIWILDMFHWPLYKVTGELLGVVPNFISSVIYGFFLVPVIFAIIGLFKSRRPLKFIFSLLIASFIIFFFALRLYLPRHAFLLFIMIYPLAVSGIDWAAIQLSQRRLCRPIFFYFLVYLLIFLPAFFEVFKIYEYLGVPYS